MTVSYIFHFITVSPYLENIDQDMKTNLFLFQYCLFTLFSLGIIHAEPLHKFAQKGDLEKVKKLVLNGNNIEERDSIYGRTALQVAIREGHQDIVSFLIGKGAKVNASDLEGFTPMSWAAQKGRHNFVRYQDYLHQCE